MGNPRESGRSERIRSIPRRRLWRFVGVVLVAVCVGPVWLWGRDKPSKNGAVAWEQAQLKPGHVVKIDDPKTGGWGYWALYVPKDYSPDRSWPIIYCYHGVDQEAKAWPFVRLTDGAGFIIVGMEYMDRDIGAPKAEKELANLARIHALLAEKLKIDQKRQYIGGFSQGGWETAHFAEKAPKAFAGMILLGSGRRSDVANPDVQGMPIFIGAGEKDDNLASAQNAASFYRDHGANVTMEEFKGVGHTVDLKDAALKKWLQEREGAGTAGKGSTTQVARK
jgi:predicted esterase